MLLVCMLNRDRLAAMPTWPKVPAPDREQIVPRRCSDSCTAVERARFVLDNVVERKKEMVETEVNLGIGRRLLSELLQEKLSANVFNVFTCM